MPKIYSPSARNHGQVAMPRALAKHRMGRTLRPKGAVNNICLCSHLVWIKLCFVTSLIFAIAFVFLSLYLFNDPTTTTTDNDTPRVQIRGQVDNATVSAPTPTVPEIELYPEAFQRLQLQQLMLPDGINSDGITSGGHPCEIIAHNDVKKLGTTATIQNKPMLILHVGPEKTGTTAIQMTQLNSKKVIKALALDNVQILPHYNFRKIKELITKCLARPINDTHCKREDMWETFYQAIRLASCGANHHNQTLKHVLSSVEQYSGIPDNNQTILKLQSLQQFFHVKVIAFYRRPAQWTRSNYKQYRKSNLMKSGAGWYRDYFYTIKAHSQTLRSFTRHSRDTWDTVRFFGRMFGHANVHVGDFHAARLLEKEFFCHTIPNAFPTVCHFWDTEQKKSARANNNEDYLYDEDLVAVEAYHQGYFEHTATTHYISRRNATLRLKEIWDQEGRDNLPKQCMDEDTDATKRDTLWNRTISMEQQFSSNPLSEDDLRIDFDGEIAKFCEVDAKALLKLTKWQNILSSCAFQIEQTENCSKAV